MDMKISVLMENTAQSCDITPEHGLSFYVETDKHKILFDMGQTSEFAENAKKLGIDLTQVELAFLSHAHFDHSGGIAKFLEINHKAPLYLSERAKGDYYYGEDRYIGVEEDVKNHPRLVYTPDELHIDDSLTLYSCNDKARTYPPDYDGLSEMVDGELKPDLFLHEQYLLIREKGRRILISGCSHKGILNIMEWFKPDVLIGGFHYMNVDLSSGTNAVLDQAAQVLSTYDTEYYTGHCTGVPQYEYLKAKMGGKLHYMATGETFEI